MANQTLSNPILAGLTIEEQSLLNITGQLWNDFLNLSDTLDHDLKEFQDSIHRLQQIIALRVARRINPEIWRTKNDRH